MTIRMIIPSSPLKVLRLIFLTLYYLELIPFSPGSGLLPQVLLIDAGCEHSNYASDITRTIPVGNGGKFTKEAGEIYDLVWQMQQVNTAIQLPYLILMSPFSRPS
jgi:hypothetical protein